MRILAVIAFLSVAFFTNAQNKDYKWQIGVGMHGPDFKINDEPILWDYWRIKNWNITPPISKISVGKHLFKGISAEMAFSIGKVAYEPQVDKSEMLFMDLDVNAKYSFANGYILKTQSWFDPYLMAGVGYTYLARYNADKNFLAINLGAGVNFWFEKNVGINLQMLYNMLPTASVLHTANGNSQKDYMHHSAGLVFRFGKKDKDGDGVADDLDKCPDVAGVVALMGCPDKDADGVADKDDVCPDVKGAVALGGCPDTDGDGVADKEDNCPDVAGKKEMNGCPDKDGDGVIDRDDACPEIAGMMNLAGCPDKDGDGVKDSDDACPDVYGKIKGCPDTDGDGIIDSEDKCPKEAGVASLAGCPEPVEVKKVVTIEEKKVIEEKMATLAKSINFETGKDIIKGDSYDELAQVVSFMNTYPHANFKVEGHTDNVGDAAKNLELSSKRAAAVVTYLTGKGVAAARLVSKGFGSTMPKADNSTSVGRTLNRRVDITINQ
jgi:OmpA-OmpF porin, OOP family